jgi:foldase protein PrsA
MEDKMRKIKRIGTIVLVIALATSLWACGNKKDKDVTNQDGVTVAPEMSAKEKQGKTVLTVNDITVSYEEAVLYLQSRKEEIEGLYGKDVWSLVVDDEGTTYEQLLKDSVYEEIEYLMLVCSKAEELGITLSEDELLDVDEYTADFISNFSPEALEYYNVNKGVVNKIYKDNMLANKIYESLTLNVDTEVSDELARQAVFEYILVGKYGYDANGNRIEYTEEQQKEAKDRADKLREEALNANNFYDFAKANSDDEDEVKITVGKGDMKEELEKVAFALEEGEISEVIDTAEGYFIFHCVSLLDREATDSKKEDIIIERQEEAFDVEYSKWEKEKDVKLDEEIWNSIDITGVLVQ